MKHAAQPARFDPIVNQYNQLGELFRIEGRCQPGCTLFLWHQERLRRARGEISGATPLAKNARVCLHRFRVSSSV